MNKLVEDFGFSFLDERSNCFTFDLNDNHWIFPEIGQNPFSGGTFQYKS